MNSNFCNQGSLVKYKNLLNIIKVMKNLEKQELQLKIYFNFLECANQNILFFSSKI